MAALADGLTWDAAWAGRDILGIDDSLALAQTATAFSPERDLPL